MEENILYQECATCGEKLYKCIFGSDKYEGPLSIKPMSMEFINLDFSHDVCSEGSSADIEIRCKKCGSIGEIHLLAGYQTSLDVEYK